MKISIKRYRKFLILFIIVLTLIVVVSAIDGFFDNEFIGSILQVYFYIPEIIANSIFSLHNFGVVLTDSKLVYEKSTLYIEMYDIFIANWQHYFLYLRWSGLIIILIWITPSLFKKKIIFSVVFFFTHIFAVVCGLCFIGFISPALVNRGVDYFISPTLPGNFVFLIFLAVWSLSSITDIKKIFTGLSSEIQISEKRIFEILICLFLFLFLRDFILKIIPLKSYTEFLLIISRMLADFFGHEGYIIGKKLIGQHGAMELASYCLGIMTFFVYSAMIYITRPSGKEKVTVLYTLFGIGILFTFNVMRLLLVFIIAQGENGFVRASRHHEMYNVFIYIVVFILWIFWFEYLFRLRKQRFR